MPTTKRIAGKALVIIGMTWVVIVCLIAAIASATSEVEIDDMWSPFNVRNWILFLGAVTPGALLRAWGKKMLDER